METDILVIGSGLAGCAAAWAAAKKNVRVTLLTRAARPEESNTFWAHGGIIYEGKDDSPEKLVSDILAAGSFSVAARDRRHSSTPGGLYCIVEFSVA